jgi:hypothetical protein
VGPTLIIYRGYRIEPVKSWTLDADPHRKPWSIIRDKVVVHTCVDPASAMLWVDYDIRHRKRGDGNDSASERL